MKKEIEYPRYANNADTRIEYDAVYYDDEGNRRSRGLVSVNKGSDEFEKIQREFGEEQIQENKRKNAEELQSRRDRIEAEKIEKLKKDEQAELFRLKSYLFSTKLVHESANKNLRRKIRKAQTLEETRMMANVMLMTELLDVEIDTDKLINLLTEVDQDD